MRILTIIVVCACATLVFAQKPAFYAAESLKANNIPIDVTYYGSPYAYDWNSDGKKDLVCGQFSYGYVSFYPNTGTNDNPSFTTFSYLQANGSNISVYAS